MARFVGNMVEDAVDFHVLPRGEITIKAGILENDAEALTGLVLMRLWIEAVELD